MKTLTTNQRELLLFIEKHSWSKFDEENELHLKHAKTYMNKFVVDEDDQYEIADIQFLKTKNGVKNELFEFDQTRINTSIRKCSARNLDILFFGWYSFDRDSFITTRHNGLFYAQSEERLDISTILAKKGFQTIYVRNLRYALFEYE